MPKPAVELSLPKEAGPGGRAAAPPGAGPKAGPPNPPGSALEKALKALGAVPGRALNLAGFGTDAGLNLPGSGLEKALNALGAGPESGLKLPVVGEEEAGSGEAPTVVVALLGSDGKVYPPGMASQSFVDVPKMDIASLFALVREQFYRVGALEGRFGVLEGHVGALAERVAALERRVGALERRVGALERRVGALEERMAALEERMAALERRVGALEERIGALEVAVAELTVAVKALDVRLTETKAELKGDIRNLAETLGKRIDDVLAMFRKMMWVLVGGFLATILTGATVFVVWLVRSGGSG